MERGEEGSALDGVAHALPALLRAAKLGKRAARVGFDWPDVAGVRAKIDEELDELAACAPDDHAALEEEVGDLLFSVANLARHLGVEPEEALRRANRKFEQRFRGVEAELGLDAAQAGQVPLERLEAAWQAQKRKLGGQD